MYQFWKTKIKIFLYKGSCLQKYYCKNKYENTDSLIIKTYMTNVLFIFGTKENFIVVNK